LKVIYFLNQMYLYIRLLEVESEDDKSLCLTFL